MGGACLSSTFGAGVPCAIADRDGVLLAREVLPSLGDKGSRGTAEGPSGRTCVGRGARSTRGGVCGWVGRGRGRTGASPTGGRRPLLCFLSGGERAVDEIVEGFKYAEPVVAHAGAGGRSRCRRYHWGACRRHPGGTAPPASGARETPAAGRRLPSGGPRSPPACGNRRRVTRGCLKS